MALLKKGKWFIKMIDFQCVIARLLAAMLKWERVTISVMVTLNKFKVKWFGKKKKI